MRQEQSLSSSLMIELSQLRQGVLQKYGNSGAEVLDKYNPDYLFKKQIGSEECIFGEYPSLYTLKKQFDSKLPVAWLMAQLHDLSEFCGCREKLSGHTLQQCASVISEEYGYLKVTEIMLFFQKFKSGKYGRFYGIVDPLIITTSLTEFLKERNRAHLKRQEEEKEKAEAEHRKNVITYEEYCRRVGKDTKNAPQSVSFDTLPATTKQRRRNVNQEAYLNETALSLIHNTYNYKPEELKQLRDYFLQKVGCTPEEYVERFSLWHRAEIVPEENRKIVIVDKNGNIETVMSDVYEERKPAIKKWAYHEELIK